MDQTNRALIVSAALLWMFIVLVVVLLAWGAPNESIKRLGDLAGYLDRHNDTAAKLIVTFGGLILGLLSAIVIVFELAPPQTGSVRVAKVGAGDARIGTDEIQRRLEEELQSVPMLSGLQAKVIGRGNKAEVNLELYVTPEADLAATSEEACRRARELVEERIGVGLDGPPRAQVHYRELATARPAPAMSSMPGAVSTAAAPLPTRSPFASEPTHETAETTQEDRPAIT